MALPARSVRELQHCARYPTQGNCSVVHRKQHIQRVGKDWASVMDSRKTYVSLLLASSILVTNPLFYSGFWQKRSYVRYLIVFGLVRGAYFVDCHQLRDHPEY